MPIQVAIAGVLNRRLSQFLDDLRPKLRINFLGEVMRLNLSHDNFFCTAVRTEKAEGSSYENENPGVMVHEVAFPAASQQAQWIP